MLTALYIAMIIISFAMVGLVVLQGRTAGLQSRDSSSIYRTKRGLEKTMHQTTIVLAIVFLIMALITSLETIRTAPAIPAPTGLLAPLGIL